MKYEQENNRTYAVIENEYETQDCEYEQKMLQKNTIAGLLKMQTRRINNKIMFFYDVTSRQTLDKIFSYKNLAWQDFVNVINGIENMARSVDDYMLGIDSVIISPEQILNLYIFREQIKSLLAERQKNRLRIFLIICLKSSTIMIKTI